MIETATLATPLLGIGPAGDWGGPSPAPALDPLPVRLVVLLPPDGLRLPSVLALLIVVRIERSDSRVDRARDEGNETWKSEEAWSPPDEDGDPPAEDAGRMTTTSSASPRPAVPCGESSPGGGGAAAIFPRSDSGGGDIGCALPSMISAAQQRLSLSPSPRPPLRQMNAASTKK